MECNEMIECRTSKFNIHYYQSIQFLSSSLSDTRKQFHILNYDSKQIFQIFKMPIYLILQVLSKEFNFEYSVIDLIVSIDVYSFFLTLPTRPNKYISIVSMQLIPFNSHSLFNTCFRSLLHIPHLDYLVIHCFIVQSSIDSFPSLLSRFVLLACSYPLCIRCEE